MPRPATRAEMMKGRIGHFATVGARHQPRRIRDHQPLSCSIKYRGNVMPDPMIDQYNERALAAGMVAVAWTGAQESLFMIFCELADLPRTHAEALFFHSWQIVPNAILPKA